MKRFWIIDDEFESYDAEKKLLSERHPGCEIRFSKRIHYKEIEAFAPDIDALIGQINVCVDSGFLETLKKCKVVSVYGVGYNKVDIVAARKFNIAVTNVPGYCAEDVADYVMAAIFRNNKQIDRYYANISNGLLGAPAVKEKPRRVSSQKLFVVGFGNIGRMLAEKAVGMGMSVLYFDAYVSKEMKELETKIGVKRATSIEDGLGEADIVSTHITLNDETRSFFNAKMFESMKPGMLFINASRGASWTRKPFIEAVKQGIISNATLDVIVNEPPKGDDPILSVERVSQKGALF